MENCYFFRLPRELRDNIYKNLVSIKHTRIPKKPEDGCRFTTSMYHWNIDPTILRANKQIHDEAKEVMGLDNDFVVIERAAEQLEQTNDDYTEEGASILNLWPGKASETVNVPGEKMRICFAKHRQSARGPAYVMLVEELRDFCVCLSTFTDSTGQYRLKGIEACITIRQPLTPETPRARAERERSLLLPLAKLRFLEKVVIQGVKPTVERLYATQMTRPAFDPKLIKYTIEELISSGDSARDMARFDVANTYYHLASLYFHHFAKHEREVFEHPANPMAFEFKILQHRALNWIEDDSFYDALEVATLALRIAIQLFQIDAPTSGPPIDARGRIKKGALRQWKCNAIKDGAARYGQRIKSEDVGRCYYYKSITEHIVGGDKATEEAEEDKFTAIGCCVVSETVTEEENVPKELLELDARTMKRLMDEDPEDDEWEDEEGWVEEG